MDIFLFTSHNLWRSLSYQRLDVHLSSWTVKGLSSVLSLVLSCELSTVGSVDTQEPGMKPSCSGAPLLNGSTLGRWPWTLTACHVIQLRASPALHSLVRISSQDKRWKHENYTGHGLVWLTLGFSLGLPLVLGLDP